LPAGDPSRRFDPIVNETGRGRRCFGVLLGAC
jgi:hypothetical protein